ncbi:hypothetical protein F5880DRAFT_572864 [Lentinula raphanica]|nr:hypothetical protein F5880DRAFT_572864 [Lentinula raphanica]
MKRLQALRVVYVVGAVSTTLAAPTSLQPPSEALSGLEEPSTVPLYQFQAEGFPATAGLDVREPQATTTIVVDESVRTDPNDLFNKLKMWSIRDDADAHDHDHTAITLADISYNPVDSKPDTAGIDVPEPQATTIVVDSVRTQDPDDFFDETRGFRDDAGAHDISVCYSSSTIKAPLHLQMFCITTSTRSFAGGLMEEALGHSLVPPVHNLPAHKS